MKNQDRFAHSISLGPISEQETKTVLGGIITLIHWMIVLIFACNLILIRPTQVHSYVVPASETDNISIQPEDFNNLRLVIESFGTVSAQDLQDIKNALKVKM